MVIPIRDENPTTRFPIVTVALIAINLVVFFVIQLPRESDSSDLIFGFSENEEFVYEYAAIPCELSDGRPLDVEQFETQQCSAVALPGTQGSLEVFPGKNVYLAVLFSMFMHGSILHVLGNMLFLWIFGNNVEDRLGPVWFVLFYLVTGVVATMAHVLFNVDSIVPLVGASGAIAGVMGAYIVWYPHARVMSFVPIFFFFGLFELPALVVLGLWFVMQFFTNPNEGIAWLAHVGGFAVGALIAFALQRVLPPPATGRRPRRRLGDDDWDPGFGGGYRGRW
jgi:membrane associated rhomboid family serine protease